MNTHTSANPQGVPEKPTPEVEGTDVNIRAVLIFVGILLATALLIHVALYFMELQFKKRELREKGLRSQQQIRSAVARTVPTFPEPRLQLSPPADMEAFRAKEEGELTTYGWVNQTSGIVRIPIRRAMEIVAQRGLPAGRTNADEKGKSPLDLIRDRALRK
ncbi:MAG: hypothetical protein JWM16_4024 [Verrucomicrobiales bacterium]|nr:hypothetical protein [Verrucomicrobiales bacterium]